MAIRAPHKNEFNDRRPGGDRAVASLLTSLRLLPLRRL
jgi:hypothetical protein